jgi:putative intracellular protease/amidase
MYRIFSEVCSVIRLVMVATLFASSAGAEAIKVDFAAAMKQISFNPETADGNGDATGAGNGLLDAAEMALVAVILGDATYGHSAEGGATHAAVRAAYDQALASATTDLKSLLTTYPGAPVVIAGYTVAGGQGSFDAINAMCGAFGCPLNGDYELARTLDSYLGPDGDADGDGVSNRTEYVAQIGAGIAAYAAAAADPSIRDTAPASPGIFWCPMRGKPCAKVDYATAGVCKDCGMPLITRESYEKLAAERLESVKTVGILLYNGFESLDVFGPVEMWGYVKEFEIVTVAETAGPVTSTQGIAVVADYGFAECPPLDILMVPGGIGTRRELKSEAMIAFIRDTSAKAELTVSVCTGSALLAKAGVLDGHRATSNKRFFDLAVAQSDQVDWVRQARWVDDGAVITSSGVSAGTDMALHLVRRLFGEDRARQIADGAEYVWNDDASQDPFSGNLH